MKDAEKKTDRTLIIKELEARPVFRTFVRATRIIL